MFTLWSSLEILKSRCGSCFLVLAECLLATGSFSSQLELPLSFTFAVIRILWTFVIFETHITWFSHSVHFLSEVSSLSMNWVQFYFCQHSSFPVRLFCLAVILLFLAYYSPGLFTWKWLSWKLAPKFCVTFSSRLIFKIQLHWNRCCSTVYLSRCMLFNHCMTVKSVTSSKCDDL
jgi:hypothetical protein